MEQLIKTGRYQGEQAVLIDAEVSTHTSDWLRVSQFKDATIQIEIEDTATVVLEGRIITDGTQLIELGTYTVSEAITVDIRFLELRGRITSWTAGEVTVNYLGYKG